MIGYSFVRIGILFAILASAAARPAAAEVITILSGTLVFDSSGNSGRLDISGNRDFRLEAATLSGINEPFESCGFGACEPGRTVTLFATWVGNDLPGVARLRGVTYQDVGGLNSPNSADIRFSGEVPIPPVGDSPVTITAPFDFAGRFFYADSDTAPQQDAFLTGGGRVTFVLVPGADGTSWSAQSARFEFAPVKR
jgi:hypothetical protein